MPDRCGETLDSILNLAEPCINGRAKAMGHKNVPATVKHTSSCLTVADADLFCYEGALSQDGYKF